MSMMLVPRMRKKKIKDDQIPTKLFNALEDHPSLRGYLDLAVIKMWCQYVDFKEYVLC